jgi:hypothetical protein
MEELRKLVFEFKISVSDFDEPISEEVKNRIKNFIENYNNIIKSLKLENVDINDIKSIALRLGETNTSDYRLFRFKVRMFHKLVKSYKIDVPDLIDKP